MTDIDGLFDLPQGSVDSEGLTSTARRRALIEARIAQGFHPLGGHLHLHPDASRTEPSDGVTCGTCKFREVLDYHNKRYPKCLYGNGIRVSHSETSDGRRWWPACRDYECGDVS